MTLSRIKDLALAEQIDENQLAWQRLTMPITEHCRHLIAQKDYRGKKLAFWVHITSNMISMFEALKETGAEITIGACNPDSTNDAAAAYLVSKGITVWGKRGMSRDEYDEGLRFVRSAEADYLCDMGGELIASYLDKSPPAKGALEGTKSGLNLLNNRRLPFPVFDWNSIPLKERIENRFQVGDSVWPAFGYVTGLTLFGRRVLVIGYGSVGKGIAERARSLGAIVSVADLDPVRLIEARFHGCEAVDLEEGIERSQIIVTATGVERALREKHLLKARPGTIFFNAGHSNREIDSDWLYSQPHRRMKEHIERFDFGETHLYLLAKGSLLNLAAGPGPHGNDLFDHYTAVMLLGIAWMFDDIPNEIKPELQPYPAHLERQIAQLSVKIHSLS